MQPFKTRPANAFRTMATPMTALGALKLHWGYDNFRHPQADVIDFVIKCRDVLLVMPTGGGKSITYQVPPLVSGKVALVVSPLISLMEDQVAALNSRGIGAAFLGSAQSDPQITQDAWAGKYPLIYLTPELLVRRLPELRALHAKQGVALVAVDEAHCVSEWGHDFRPEYMQLGCVRRTLGPEVPLLALTATATKQVQEDICRNLGMSADAVQCVMGTDRPNLHFSVEERTGGMANVLREVLARKRFATTSRRATEPTLIYALSIKQVEEIAAFLSAPDKFGAAVGMYHAKLPLHERSKAHTAFLRDDLEVMVASSAFGMGIDKPNVRHIIHWGAPATLEAYYQQAGRAGRDGQPATCKLAWSRGDMALLAQIKDTAVMNDEVKASYEQGLTRVQVYCSSGSCRHAIINAHFRSTVVPEEHTYCRGGCDSCDRKKKMSTQTGLVAGPQDVMVDARMLIATVNALKGKFGMMRPIQVLRGSTNKTIPEYQRDIKDSSGDLLYGAGKAHSEDYYKNLADLLVQQALLTYSAMPAAVEGQRGYTALTLTAQGRDWLQSPTALLLELPPAMMTELAPVKKGKTVSKKTVHQAAQEEAAALLSAEANEVAALVEALKERRKRVANANNMPPDSLVSEGTLQLIAQLRPADMQQMAQVAGMSKNALAIFGEALIRVVANYVATSDVLRHNANWSAVQRTRVLQEETVGLLSVSPQLMATARNLLYKPTPPAMQALLKFQAGLNVDQIVASNGRSIMPSSILGYLCNAAGSDEHGVSVSADVLCRLAVEAGLDGASAHRIAMAMEKEQAPADRALPGTMIARALPASMNATGGASTQAASTQGEQTAPSYSLTMNIKTALGPDTDMIQVRMVAVLVVRRAVWFADAAPHTVNTGGFATSPRHVPGATRMATFSRSANTPFGAGAVGPGVRGFMAGAPTGGLSRGAVCAGASSGGAEGRREEEQDDFDEEQWDQVLAAADQKLAQQAQAVTMPVVRLVTNQPMGGKWSVGSKQGTPLPFSPSSNASLDTTQHSNSTRAAAGEGSATQITARKASEDAVPWQTRRKVSAGAVSGGVCEQQGPGSGPLAARQDGLDLGSTGASSLGMGFVGGQVVGVKRPLPLSPGDSSDDSLGLNSL